MVSQELKSHVTKYIMICGSISAFMALTTYLLSIKLLEIHYLLFYSIPLVFGITYIIFSIRSATRWKKVKSGIISLKVAFLIVLVVYTVSNLFGIGLNVILFGIIDSGFGERLNDATIGSTIDFYESFNMSEEQLDQIIVKVEKSNITFQYSVVGQLLQILSSIVGGAFFGIITALIIKKKPEPGADLAN